MKNKAWLCLSIVTLLALSLSSQAAYAAPPSPFVGHWQGIDVDSSDIRLTIAGPPGGPFQITWTESYITLCEGQAGIVRGTGVLSESDGNLLEADLVVECFQGGATEEIHLTFRYHPTTGALSTIYGNGMMAVFTHPGAPQGAPDPVQLMTNYQEDWASGFYEEGHTVWLAVTENDGTSVKATADMVTGPQPGWDGGEIGFASQPWEWEPGQPDIVPGDWVYAWIDNGASAQMRVGEIIPWVDLENDQVLGTVSAPWYSEEVYVYCVVWGVTDPRNDTIMADGSDEFICSWSGGTYDIQPGDVAEVQYYGSDGHAVDYYIFTPNPHFSAFPEWEYLEGYEWPDGSIVSISVAGKEACSTSATAGYPEWDPNNTFFGVGFPEGCDLAAGDVVTASDGMTTRTHTVRNLAITSVDEAADMVAGTSDPGEMIHVWPHETGEQIEVAADEYGSWLADLGAIYDIALESCGRSEIRDEAGNATAVDWCVPNPEIRAWLGNQRVEGYMWPAGEWINLEIYDPGDGSTWSASAPAEETDWGTFVGFSTAGWDLAPGQEITMSSGGLSKAHTILPVSITIADPDLDFVEGTASPDGRILLCVYDGGCDPPAEIFADASGYWSMNYSGQLDILAGGGMDATEFDDDGDGTSFDYWIPEGPPAIGLRVNYGHDWVESFYEAGHWVELAVTEADGSTVKATVTVFTEPKDYWGGESGFTTNETGWTSGTTPDLQPYDWVFAVVDNGVTAQVQLGDIQGEVSVFEDRVSGTIDAAWISDPVPVECYDWGSGGDAGMKGAGTIYANGVDAYNCGWDPETEWDLQPWQEIGVGYLTPDGHWVANAFHAEHWMAVWTYDMPSGFWSDGDHSYYFEWSNSVPSPGDGRVMDPVQFAVSSDAGHHDGYAVLWSRSFASPLVWNGSSCEVVASINPDQPTRLAWGWVNDYSMSFDGALDHFNSFVVQVFWDGEGGGSAVPTMGELMPWYGPATSDEYRCALTEHP